MQPPSKSEDPPQTGRNSCVNFSDVIHYPKKILRTPSPIRDILYNLLPLITHSKLCKEQLMPWENVERDAEKQDSARNDRFCHAHRVDDGSNKWTPRYCNEPSSTLSQSLGEPLPYQPLVQGTRRQRLATRILPVYRTNMKVLNHITDPKLSPNFN